MPSGRQPCSPPHLILYIINGVFVPCMQMSYLWLHLTFFTFCIITINIPYIVKPGLPILARRTRWRKIYDGNRVTAWRMSAVTRQRKNTYASHRLGRSPILDPGLCRTDKLPRRLYCNRISHIWIHFLSESAHLNLCFSKLLYSKDHVRYDDRLVTWIVLENVNHILFFHTISTRRERTVAIYGQVAHYIKGRTLF